MRPGARARQRAGRIRATGDTGITLIEVMVSMTVMTVVMAMFTAGVIQTFRSANKTESTSIAQSQLHLAFLRLDKEIRYAAGISTQGLVGADPYVEYLTTNTGAPVCTELRLRVATKQLQRRTWTKGTPTPTPTAWIPLASGVTSTPPSTQPFTFTAANATFNRQRLALKLTTQSGAGNTATSKQSEMTFTALNTSLGTSSDTVCNEGRAIP